MTMIEHIYSAFDRDRSLALFSFFKVSFLHIVAGLVSFALRVKLPIRFDIHDRPTGLSHIWDC